MDDALGVGLLEGLDNLLRDLECLVGRDLTALEPLLELLAFDELEDEERFSPRLLESVNGGDVWVVEGAAPPGRPARTTSFGYEAPRER